MRCTLPSGAVRIHSAAVTELRTKGILHMLTMANLWLQTLATLMKSTYLTPTPGITCHLAVAPFNPTPTSLVGSFTEASFTGYAAAVLDSFTVSHINPADGGQLVTAIGTASFTPSATLTTPVTIAGYWLVDTLGNYIGGEPLNPQPVLSNAHTPLQLTVGVALLPGSFTSEQLP